MNRHNRSPKNLFLLELLISIGLFMLLLVVGLMFFIKAHLLTKKATSLHESVAICSNAASIYENGDGSLEAVREYYPDSSIAENQLTLYFNQDFKPCSSQEGHYLLTMELQDTKNNLTAAHLVFYSNDEKLYSIEAYHYQKLTAKGGHER